MKAHASEDSRCSNYNLLRAQLQAKNEFSRFSIANFNDVTHIGGNLH
jgi:hypothetical protein